jgi:hypothetical protein
MGCPAQGGGAVSPPHKRKAPEGTGADATTKTNRQPESYTDRAAGLHAVATVRVAGQIVYGRGFTPRFLTGKVRPAPREPGITHYACVDDCCRWTA